MEDIIQLFRRMRRGSTASRKSVQSDLEATASEADSNSLRGTSPPDIGLRKAKFKLKKPRLTSPTEKRIFRSKNKKKNQGGKECSKKLRPNTVVRDMTIIIITCWLIRYAPNFHKKLKKKLKLKKNCRYFF
jgi:hypothetical protein